MQQQQDRECVSVRGGLHISLKRTSPGRQSIDSGLIYVLFPLGLTDTPTKDDRAEEEL